MADPITWLAVASAVVGATGTVVETESAVDDAQAEANIAKSNAEIAAQQAGQAEDAKRKSNRDLLARQRAAFSENGIVNDTGTAVGVQAQTGIAAELDALNIRYEGMLQRTNYLNQALAAKARAKNTRTSGYLAAASQLLGGGMAAKGRAPSTGAPPSSGGTRAWSTITPFKRSGTTPSMKGPY